MADFPPHSGHSGIPQSSQVKSATRTLDIIEFVVAHDRPLVAQEIATALGIPVSSLSYLLATLVERDYLARDGRRYSAGPGLARLQARSGNLQLAERAAPLVRALRTQLNETASFFILTDWDVEALVTESSEQALRYSVDIGKRMPLHAMASGKAVLAALPEAEIDRYFRETIRERFTLHRHQRKGTAQADRRHPAHRLRLYGRGIFAGHPRRQPGGDAGGIPVGSLSVAIPTARWNQTLEGRVLDMLQRTCGLLDTV